MKKYFLILSLLVAPLAFGALGSNLDRVTVGTYLYPNTNALPLGSSTAKWAGWLSSINGEDIEDVILPTGGSAIDYLTGSRTWANLTTTAVTEGTNLYYTDARVRAAVSATAPITFSGGGVIACTAASTSVAGCLSSTDWNTFNNKQPAGTYVTTITVASANGFAGSSSGGATPALTISTSITGLLKGNGTAISAASSGTDYAPATSGSAYLKGNGSGGFTNQTTPLPSADLGGGRTINAQTGTTYTFALSDASNAGGFPLVTSSNASAQTFTVPPQSDVVWLTGAQIEVCQYGAGKLTIAQGSGVTINSKGTNKAAGGQYVCLTLVRKASDEWLLAGDLIP